jgi:hypothetical protein
MCFRPYFLYPLIAAWSALIVQMGRAHYSVGAMAAGMLLPLAGLFLAFPGAPQNSVEATFLGRLAAVGSPPQFVLWTMLAFYAWAWRRRVPSAEGFLAVLGLFSSILGPRTVDWHTLVLPLPAIVGAVAALLLVQAIRRESTWRALAAASLVAAAVHFAGGRLAGESLWFWRWHAPLAAALLLPAAFNDPLAKLLRQLAWPAVPAVALLSAAIYPWAFAHLPKQTLGGYLAVLLLASLVLWQREKYARPLAAAGLTLAANLLAHLRPLYLVLSNSPLAEGLPWLAGGLAIVLVALTISLLKMGLWRGAWDCLERVNGLLCGNIRPG